MNKNISLKKLVLIIGLLFFVSCSFKSSQKSSEKLSIFVWGSINYLNPLSIDNIQSWEIQKLIWDKLLISDKNMKWTPWIAQNWTFNDDKTELILKIRPGLRWNDGSLVTQKDFIFSFMFYKDSENRAAIWTPFYKRIKKVSYSNNELRLTLDKKLKKDKFFASHIYWDEILSTARLLPYDLKKNKYKGTGPYSLKKFSSLKPLTFLKNKKSWVFNFLEQDLPDRISIKSLSSKSLLKKILQNSEAIVFGYDLFEFDNKRWVPLFKNQWVKKIIFNQKRIGHLERQGLKSLVLDKDFFLKFDFKEKYKDFKVFNNSPKGLQNLNQGFEFEVLYSSKEDEKWLTVWKEYLKSKKIRLNVTFLSTELLQKRLLEKNFEAYLSLESSEDFRPLYSVLHTQGAYNLSSWNNVELDAALDKRAYLSSSDQIQKNTARIQQIMSSEVGQIDVFSHSGAYWWLSKICDDDKKADIPGPIYLALACMHNETEYKD